MLAASCSQEMTDGQGVDAAKGEIEIQLSQDTPPQAKSVSEFTVPDINTLKVEVFKKAEDGLVRLYRDTYANTLGKMIPLNCADYRLLASHGDSLAAGFDRAYFSGICDFELSPQESQIVETVVKVSNVKVSVKYGDNLIYDYPDFYSVIKSVTKGGTKRSLKFYNDETRAGFVPLGMVNIELYAKIGGEWKYYSSEQVQAEPGDDLTFTIETVRLESQAQFNVTIQQPDRQPVNVGLVSGILPADSPEMEVNGFGGSLVVTEGDDAQDDLKLDLVADGEIKECWLNIDSDYLSALGLPSEIDLADTQLDPALKETLESFGLRWMTSMKGRKFAYVDFSGITRYLSSTQCDSDNLFEAAFSVRLVDGRHGMDGSTHNGLIQSESMTFLQGVPAPKISVKGFGQGPIKVMEAVETSTDDLKVDLQASGRIAKCVVSIQSPYLQELGVPESVDLASIDETTGQILRSVGLDWSEDLANSHSAVVDFNGVLDFMETSMYSASKGNNFAKFALSVENAVYRDGNIKDASAEVGQFTYIIPTGPSATGNYAEIDVRARRMNNYSTVLSEGNFNAWAMQCSPDNGNSWINMPASLNGSTLHCAQVTGLSSTETAGVTHSVRAIYNNNPDITYPLSSFTTEAAAQVPNSDFDSWTTSDFKYYVEKVIFSGGGNYTTRDWYLPWTSDENKCWDVNSCKTMPTSTTPKNLDFKVFPAVSYSTDTHDSKGFCAQMVGVFVCNYATSSTYGNDSVGGIGGSLITGISVAAYTAAGEIFIGTADNSGKHASEGYPFTSRPDKLKFEYKYAPVNNETYMVTIILTDDEENVIAEAETTSGPASSSWAEASLDLIYDQEFKDVRPSNIYIAFRSASCADSEIGYEKNQTVEMAGSNFKGHLGSVLKIDNVELIYQ